MSGRALVGAARGLSSLEGRTFKMSRNKKLKGFHETMAKSDDSKTKSHLSN